VAAMLRASGASMRRVSILVTAGAVVAAVALVWLPLLWLAVGLIVAAARVSAQVSARSSGATTGEAPARATG